jgi:hypothetical protein
MFKLAHVHPDVTAVPINDDDTKLWLPQEDSPVIHLDMQMATLNKDGFVYAVAQPLHQVDGIGFIQVTVTNLNARSIGWDNPIKFSSMTRTAGSALAGPLMRQETDASSVTSSGHSDSGNDEGTVFNCSVQDVLSKKKRRLPIWPFCRSKNIGKHRTDGRIARVVSR